MSNAIAKRAKPRSRPVYFRVERVVIPETGEQVGALVPMTGWDRREMKERKYSVGTELRAELKKPRNPKFNNLVHALGAMCAEHIEAFHGQDAHAVIKTLQRESGICCEEMETEIPGLGQLLLKVPQSIAFDAMDEGEFSELFRGLCRHVAAKHWPSMSEDQIAEQAQLMESNA